MDEVLDDCDRALRLNERSLNAVLYKAEALNGLGKIQAAKELLDTVLESHPDQNNRIQGTNLSNYNIVQSLNKLNQNRH